MRHETGKRRTIGVGELLHVASWVLLGPGLVLTGWGVSSFVLGQAHSHPVAGQMLGLAALGLGVTMLGHGAVVRGVAHLCKRADEARERERRPVHPESRISLAP